MGLGKQSVNCGLQLFLLVCMRVDAGLAFKLAAVYAKTSLRGKATWAMDAGWRGVR